MGLAAATLATLLGGGSGRVTWPSAAGGEDEELPDKTPGGGDCAGGGGDCAGGGESEAALLTAVPIGGLKRRQTGHVAARQKKKEAWLATQCTKVYPS